MEKDQIIMGLHQGDHKTFGYLFDMHYIDLCVFIKNILNGSNEAIEDIANEAFMALWLKKRDFNCPEKVKGYLYVVAYHKCLKYNRSVQRARARLSQYHRISDHSNNPLSPRFDHEAGYKLIASNIKSFSPQVLKVITLHYEKGMKLCEVSEHLNVGIGTVKRYHWDAVNKLRQIAQTSGLI